MKLYNGIMFIGISIIITALSVCCSCNTDPLPDTTDKPEEEGVAIDRTAFAKGADISWVTQMESLGMKFYNSAGEERECTELMKEIGMNSVRYRVWVNPAEGWNSAGDVLAKALRAQKLGMRIMIDFHYSDTWADPAHQTPPAAWSTYDLISLTHAVKNHTVEVLSLLKKFGVEVEWVQVGNETRTGMLWPLGSSGEANGMNYASLTNAGYYGVKEVYPDAKVIVHVDNGHDRTLYDRLFPILIRNNCQFDMIGMSLYPCWWQDSIGGYNTEWKEKTDACIENITYVAELFKKRVIICETGMPASLPELGKEMLTYLLEESKATGYCDGVFYWEPQAPEGYNNGYGLGAFENGRPTAALDPFKN